MATRADVIIATPNSSARSSQSNYLVIDSGGNIYAFDFDTDNILYWKSSYDGGFTWSAPNLIKSFGANTSGFGIWYAGWTPNMTGTMCHIVYFDANSDDVLYRPFSLTNESLGAEVVIMSGTSTGAAANTCISVTQAIGGNLYCGFDIDGGTETGFYRSTDGGLTWSARTDVNEATSDYYYLAPGFAADNQDIICIFWDRSANEISRKLYDDSGNSWSESSIATSMTAIATSTSACQFAISVSASLSKVLLAAWSNRNTVNADLRFWEIDEASITERTNVVLNSGGNQESCSLLLVSSTIYCFYIGKSDGSETLGTNTFVYYKTSSDRGVTWSSETVLSTLGRSYDYLFTVPIVLDTLGKIFAAFELQVATIDQMLLSCAYPSSGASGGGGVLVGSIID